MHDAMRSYLRHPYAVLVHLGCHDNPIVNYDNIVGFDVCVDEPMLVKL